MSYESAAREIAQDTAPTIPILCPRDLCPYEYVKCWFPSGDPATTLYAKMQCPVCGHETVVDCLDSHKV